MTVIRRDDLYESPLADLHALAAELGIEGYRTLRREALIEAILERAGEASEPVGAAADAGTEVENGAPSAAVEEGSAAAAAARPEDAVPLAGSEELAGQVVTGGDETQQAEKGAAREPAERRSGRGEGETVVAGVLDLLANGSGFIRVDPVGPSRRDVYVSPAQIRRCGLRAGDEVRGRARPPRRGERHPSLVRVESVAGGPPEPPLERPRFDELEALYPIERLDLPSPFDRVPVGRGSRVAVAGPPWSGRSSLLRRVAQALVSPPAAVPLVGLESNATAPVVVAGLVAVRPEEVGEWRAIEGVRVFGGSFDESGEAVAQAVDWAVEFCKRHAERGRDAVLLLDDADRLPTVARRRAFAAGRRVAGAATVTVFAACDERSELVSMATARVTLGPRPPHAPAGELHVLFERSGTLRADLLT